MTDKEGNYCTICGGMVPPGYNDVKQIEVDGKVIGINKLDFILEDVKKRTFHLMQKSVRN